MLTRAIIVIEPDDKRYVIPPEDFNWEKARKVLDGYVEPVRVLRIDLEGYVFTYMFVDEEGMLKSKPVNAGATKLHRANIERQFPLAENPFEEANNEFDKMTKDFGIFVVNSDTPEMRNNPQIYGTAIWFRGYTCEECEKKGLV